MAQQATATKVVDITTYVRRRPETAAETTWDDITLHVTNIDRVMAMILEDYGKGFRDPTIKAGEAVRMRCTRMRRLQEVQRKGYDKNANSGIGHIATVQILTILDAVEWPHVPALWLDSVRLSARTIGEIARQRQRTH